ncbi:hypothetical protein [Streptomyces odorifer]|uniref:Uncharacterized protein n=1 Tax=Streptomyces odorifer TaxID=53450 RepID=A0A7Y6F4Y8_9ACTN|nr:hypothetical protein [Streptomyces odorifer]NUV31948.1 hypothetical protein [Streptomyces odorifer]
MGLFRKSMPLSELTQSQEGQGGKEDQFVTVYQASRGGWFPPAEKPVPGKPKKGRR